MREPERALVLTHDPRTALDVARAFRAPLVLSGHTHAGQVDLPLLPIVAAHTGMPYLRGFHRLDRTDLYVSAAGIGHSLHGLRSPRTAPEVAFFDLDPDATARRSLTTRTSLA